VINLVDEADGRGFVRICIRQFYPNLPDTALVDTYQIEYEFIRQNPVIDSEKKDASGQLSNQSRMKLNRQEYLNTINRGDWQFSFPETQLPPLHLDQKQQRGSSAREAGGRKKKPGFGARVITFGRPLKFDEEFLHPVVHHLHLVVAHHPATPRNQESRRERPDQKNKQNMSGKIGKTNRGVQDPHSFMRSISRRLLGDDILESGEPRTAATAEGRNLLSSPLRSAPRLGELG
jgi:hypothetical protein